MELNIRNHGDGTATAVLDYVNSPGKTIVIYMLIYCNFIGRAKSLRIFQGKQINTNLDTNCKR